MVERHVRADVCLAFGLAKVTPDVGDVEVAAEDDELDQENGIVNGLRHETNHQFLFLALVFFFKVIVRIHVIIMVYGVIEVLSIRYLGALSTFQGFHLSHCCFTFMLR